VDTVTLACLRCTVLKVKKIPGDCHKHHARAGWDGAREVMNASARDAPSGRHGSVWLRADNPNSRVTTVWSLGVCCSPGLGSVHTVQEGGHVAVHTVQEGGHVAVHTVQEGGHVAVHDSPRIGRIVENFRYVSKLVQCNHGVAVDNALDVRVHRFDDLRGHRRRVSVSVQSTRVSDDGV
jgi:hypothetical protein